LPIKREDFSIWFGLFRDTVNKYFEGEKAEFAKDLAGRVAASFTIRMEMAGKFDQDEYITVNMMKMLLKISGEYIEISHCGTGL